MTEQERWEEEAHKAFTDRKLSQYHSEHDFVMGYLQACRKRQEEIERRPKIVCLCGSTRFKDEFVKINLKETLDGNIVLSIGCDLRTDQETFGTLSQDQETWPFHIKEIKQKLDELHLRKIELADEIIILNVGGYIGKSTTNELNHAKKLGKKIRFLEEAK